MSERDELERLAWWLDDRFRIPGTGRRVGIDGLLGLVPGIGDTATTALAGYIVYRAWRMGAPAHLLVRMAANVAIDFAAGSVPLVGDLFDLAFRANRRNVNLLDGWLSGRDPVEARRPERRRGSL